MESCRYFGLIAQLAIFGSSLHYFPPLVQFPSSGKNEPFTAIVGHTVTSGSLQVTCIDPMVSKRLGRLWRLFSGGFCFFNHDFSFSRRNSALRRNFPVGFCFLNHGFPFCRNRALRGNFPGGACFFNHGFSFSCRNRPLRYNFPGGT